MVVKVASTAALYHKHQESGNAIASSAEEPATATEAATSGDDSDSDIEKMRAKLQQLQHEQQQQYLRQQQQQLQLHLQQMQQSGAGVLGGGAAAAAAAAGGGLSAGETAYLLERADNSIAPIYGTWGTKARRPLHATSSLESDDAHVYERLPKRSATMTPLRGLAPRDQMPRPPRLATQDMQLSLGSPSPPPPPTTALLRRQFSETPGTRAQREEGGFKPKPFHFPYDGPLPEQFSKGEARPELNNIQDILQHLHISGVAPSKLPPMVMMPTGLHIAGNTL